MGDLKSFMLELLNQQEKQCCQNEQRHEKQRNRDEERLMKRLEKQCCQDMERLEKQHREKTSNDRRNVFQNSYKNAQIVTFIITSLHMRCCKTSSLALWLECSPMVQETWVPSQVMSYQRL